jgi:hypothetical protein
MELCIRAAPSKRQTNKTGSPYFTSDGMGRIPTIFLCSHQKVPGHGHGLYQKPMNLLRPHNIVKYTIGNPEYKALPELQKGNIGYVYMLEVYVDNFMSLIIPASWEQIRHIATAVMTGIQGVFPPDNINNDNPISEKMLKKRRGHLLNHKNTLGIQFQWGGKNYVAQRGKTQKTTHNPKRVDKGRQTRNNRDTFHGV